jgi:hypothetical protein
MKLFTSLILIALFTSVAHAEQGDAEDRALIEKSTAAHAKTAGTQRLSVQEQDKAPPIDVRAPAAASNASSP